MKSFNEFMNEASLGRFWEHLKEGDPLAIISADRNEVSPKENKKNTEFLRTFILNAGFGFAKARGGYSEITNGNKVDVDNETSTIVYTTPDREKELFKLIMSLGVRFKQDSIFFVGTDGNAFWYGTREDSSCGGIGKKIPLGKFHPKQIGKYYTKIGKKHFSFDDIKENVFESKPTTIEMRAMDRIQSLLKKSVNEDLDFFELWSGNIQKSS